MLLVGVQDHVRNELAGRSGSHRVAMDCIVARERITVHAHRIRSAAVAVEAPHGGRAREVQVERGLFADRDRLVREIPDLHAVVDGAGAFARVPLGDDLQRRVVARKSDRQLPPIGFRPRTASTNRHLSDLHWPATST